MIADLKTKSYFLNLSDSNFKKKNYNNKKKTTLIYFFDKRVTSRISKNQWPLKLLLLPL